MNANGKIQHINPELLVPHPLTELVPMTAEDESQNVALIESIRERGIDQAILADASYKILDGRHRHRAAKTLKLATVPVVIREETEAASIILDSLLARRHFTKSALAYIALPLYDKAAAEGRQRRTGAKPSGSAFAMKASDFSTRLGISKDTFEQARDVRELFAKRPDLKAEFEPKIFSGDMSLWNVRSAAGGRDKTKGVARKDSQRTFEDLVGDWIELGVHRLKHWEKIGSKADRLKLTHKAADALVGAFPDEWLPALERAIRARKGETR